MVDVVVVVAGVVVVVEVIVGVGVVVVDVDVVMVVVVVVVGSGEVVDCVSVTDADVAAAKDDARDDKADVISEKISESVVVVKVGGVVLVVRSSSTSDDDDIIDDDGCSGVGDHSNLIEAVALGVGDSTRPVSINSKEVVSLSLTELASIKTAVCERVKLVSKSATN